MKDDVMLHPEKDGTARIEPVEHIMQFFEYDHLRPDLQVVSQPFCLLARAIVYGDTGSTVSAGNFSSLPRNPERTVALRKLLEAKDAAVRALLAKA